VSIIRLPVEILNQIEDEVFYYFKRLKTGSRFWERDYACFLNTCTPLSHFTPTEREARFLRFLEGRSDEDTILKFALRIGNCSRRGTLLSGGG
jgi:hypothetical protein